MKLDYDQCMFQVHFRLAQNLGLPWAHGRRHTQETSVSRALLIYQFHNHTAKYAPFHSQYAMVKIGTSRETSLISDVQKILC